MLNRAHVTLLEQQVKGIQASGQPEEIQASQLKQLVEGLQARIKDDVALLAQIDGHRSTSGSQRATTDLIERLHDAREEKVDACSEDQETRNLVKKILKQRELREVRSRLAQCHAELKTHEHGSFLKRRSYAQDHPEAELLVRIQKEINGANGTNKTSGLSYEINRLKLAIDQESQDKLSKAQALIKEHKLDENLYEAADAQVEAILVDAHKDQIGAADSMCQNASTYLDDIGKLNLRNDPLSDCYDTLLHDDQHSLPNIKKLFPRTKQTDEAEQAQLKAQIQLGDIPDFDISTDTKYSGDFVPPPITQLDTYLNQARGLTSQLSEQITDSLHPDPAVAKESIAARAKTEMELKQTLKNLRLHCARHRLLEKQPLIKGIRKKQIASLCAQVKGPVLRVGHDHKHYQVTPGTATAYGDSPLRRDRCGGIKVSRLTKDRYKGKDGRYHKITEGMADLELPAMPPYHLLDQNDLLKSSQGVESCGRFSIQSVMEDIYGDEYNKHLEIREDGTFKIKFRSGAERDQIIQKLRERNNEYKQWKANNQLENGKCEASIEMDDNSPKPEPTATLRQQGPAWQQQRQGQDCKQEVPSEDNHKESTSPPVT